MGAVKILKKLSVYLFYFKDDLYLDKWHVMLSHLITNGLAPKVFFSLGFQQYGHGFFMSFWISRFYRSKKFFLFYSSQDPSWGGHWDL